MRRPNYTDWEHVFLDTSIIFDYFHAKRAPGNSTRADYVKLVLDDLLTKKTSDEKTRKFYVSAITISEMLDRSDDRAKTEKIVADLNAPDMTYVPFDTDVAQFMTSHYHSILATDKLREIARQLSWPEHDLLMAREWITRDLMIMASAHYLNCDVALTVDWRTFHPLAEKVDCFCGLVLDGNFDISASGANIFSYFMQNDGRPKAPQSLN